MRFVNYKDRKAVAAALKPIYQATAEAVRTESATFAATELGRVSKGSTVGSSSLAGWIVKRCLMTPSGH